MTAILSLLFARTLGQIPVKVWLIVLSVAAVVGGGSYFGLQAYNQAIENARLNATQWFADEVNKATRAAEERFARKSAEKVEELTKEVQLDTSAWNKAESQGPQTTIADLPVTLPPPPPPIVVPATPVSPLIVIHRKDKARAKIHRQSSKFARDLNRALASDNRLLSESSAP